MTVFVIRAHGTTSTSRTIAVLSKTVY